MTVIDNDLSLELIQRNRLPWNGFLVVDMSWTSTWPSDSLERGCVPLPGTGTGQG